MRESAFWGTYPEGEVYTISSDGGESPVWSRDGDEIFYRRGNASMVVRVTTSPEFRAAAPEVLHEQRFDWGVGAASLYPTYRKPFDVILGAAKTGEWRTLGDDFRTLPARELLGVFTQIDQMQLSI